MAYQWWHPAPAPATARLMFGEYSLIAYLGGLAAMLIAVSLTYTRTPDTQLARSAVAIVGNWIAGFSFIALTGWYDCWPFNILLDTATAVLILWHPAGRWQSMLGVSYCLQICFHAGYGLNALDLFGQGSSADTWKYYNALTLVAWFQLMIVGGWCVDLGVRSRRDNRGTSASRTGSGRVEPS